MHLALFVFPVTCRFGRLVAKSVPGVGETMFDIQAECISIFWRITDNVETPKTQEMRLLLYHYKSVVYFAGVAVCLHDGGRL